MAKSKYNEKVEKIMTDSLCLSIPNKPEYVSVVRLTASAIASRIGFNIEQIEDIKVAIAEACTNVVKHGENNEETNYSIEFLVGEEKIEITIKDQGIGFCCQDLCDPDLSSPKEGGLGLFIIRSLMDEVDIQSAKGKGTTIKMTKFLGDDF